MTAGRAGNALSRHLPIAGWLPRYDRPWLRGDVAAGIAVTALIVPKNLGYAGIAGRAGAERPVRRRGGRDPLRAVLHVAADLDGAELVAGGGRRRRGAADRAGGRACGGAGRGDHAGRPACCSCCSPCCGWAGSPGSCRRPVITGFLAGAAIDVVIGELPKLTGTDRRRRQRLARARLVGADARRHPRRRPCWSGAVSLAVILACASSRRRSPARWCSSSAGCSPSPLFDLGAHGVALVGDVPRGLPAPALPSTDIVTDRLPDDHRRRGRRCC